MGYFREESSGRFFVIECNPRASSVLEGVSQTPGWGASFFGKDVRSSTCYHKTGFWAWWDPLPVFVAEIAWPLEMLRIKGALKGGALPRTPRGLPIDAGKPLTAQFPGFFEALGLNYHHLDVNIGKVILPGRTVGREYAIFSEIEQDSDGAYLRGQARQRGREPRILCDAAWVAANLVGMDDVELNITRLATDPVESMRASHGEQVVLGSAVDTMRNLTKQGKQFDVIVLPEMLLSEVPDGVLAAGGCLLASETLPVGRCGKKEGRA